MLDAARRANVRCHLQVAKASSLRHPLNVARSRATFNAHLSRIAFARPIIAGSTISPDASRPTPPDAVTSSTSRAQSSSAPFDLNTSAITGNWLVAEELDVVLDPGEARLDIEASPRVGEAEEHALQ